MEKKLSDEELDRLLEEQFLKEADLIENALFSDDSEEVEEETEEELEEAYNDLMARLKAKGKYCEEGTEIPAGQAIPIPERETNHVREMATDSRRSHKMVRAAGFAAVCVLGVFAASMTSEANRKYFINSMKYLAGDDTRMVIDNDESNEQVNADEYKAREDIKNKLGIEIPRFFYRPDSFAFYNYEVNELGKLALVEYKYGDMIISLDCLKRDVIRDSSNFSMHGEKIATAILRYGKISVDIFEVKNEGDIQPSYTAQWEREDVSYNLSGKMEKEEFIKIVEKMRF